MNKNKLQVQGGCIHFSVDVTSTHSHLFRITLTVAKPSALQRLSLPVWIPGSYLVREFSKNLQHLQAHQGRRQLAVSPIDKCSWSVVCDIAKPLLVTYEIYALDNSVRTAWLDAARGFFNGCSMFLRVEGQTDAPHQVEIVAPSSLKTWRLVTGLAAVDVGKSGFGSYRADDYDELVDCPVELGAFWSGEFKAGGVPHRFVEIGRAHV